MHTTDPAAAFDAAADRYDNDASRNIMMLWLRRISHARLIKAFQAGDKVLEIGCGTGIEALSLAASGISVLATDASPGMIEILEGKIKLSPSNGVNLQTMVLSASELHKLIPLYGPASFTGAYSSLGPLNCTPELASIAQALALLIEPGGKLVLSLLNKYCLWETAWHLLAGKPKLAFRRWRGRAFGTATPGGSLIEVYYWPVGEIERAFKPFFNVTRRSSFPWTLPPTYAADFMTRHPRLFAMLHRIERLTAMRWPFYLLGDHVHLEMVRHD